MNALNKKKAGIAGLYSGLLLVSLSILGLIYVNELKKYPKGVNPPLESGVPFTKMRMNSGKAFTYKAPTGTTIHIPANAVVTKQGKPVKGKITLQFREFQNADEIALSGIPMQFGPDRTDYFSSAGMIELRAFQGKEELELAKDVKIELAAPFEPDAEFKLYKLEDDQHWDEGKNFKRETKKEKTLAIGTNDKRSKSIKERKETKIKVVKAKVSVNPFEFELIGDPIRMPHLKSWEGVTWSLISSDSTLEPTQALRINWDVIDIAPVPSQKGIFQLTFSKESLAYSGELLTTHFSMLASPKLKETDLNATLKAYDKDVVAYNDLMVKVRDEEGRKNTEASVISKFTISSFGIYNIDKLKNLNQAPHIALSFDFEDQLIPELNHVVLYMVMKGERSVFSFNAFEWEEIPYIEGECYFFAVLPGMQVAYISTEQIKKKFGVQKPSKYEKNKYHFKTERLSPGDFVKLVLPKDGESRFL